MARIRTIKPDFFRHEGLYKAEVETGLPLRVAFAGLWTASDREGRFEWRPMALKLDCLPYDEIDFSRVLDALSTRGFIVRYASAGVEYGYIPSWRKHQVINNRESVSKLPIPNENNNIPTREPRVEDASLTRYGNASGEGEGEGKGKETTPSVLKNTEIPPRTGSLAAAAGVALEALKATPSDEFPERRGELHAVCAANNVRAAAMHPQLVEWAKANVTVEQLREAIAQARIHKPPPESLNPAYLAPIVDRLRLGKRPDPNSAWALDDEAAIAKGRELGVTAKRGEDFNAYRQRLREALQQVGRSHVG